MNFTKDEENLLILYFDGERLTTIQTLKDMRDWLQPDEKILKEMTDSLIRKLTEMTDEDFAALDLDWYIEGF